MGCPFLRSMKTAKTKLVHLVAGAVVETIKKCSAYFVAPKRIDAFTFSYSLNWCWSCPKENVSVSFNVILMFFVVRIKWQNFVGGFFRARIQRSLRVHPFIFVCAINFCHFKKFTPIERNFRVLCAKFDFPLSPKQSVRAILYSISILRTVISFYEYLILYAWANDTPPFLSCSFPFQFLPIFMSSCCAQWLKKRKITNRKH